MFCVAPDERAAGGVRYTVDQTYSDFSTAILFNDLFDILSSLERAKNIGRFGRLGCRTVWSVHS